MKPADWAHMPWPARQRYLRRHAPEPTTNHQPTVAEWAEQTRQEARRLLAQMNEEQK